MSTEEPVPLSENATRERLAWAAEAEPLFRRILAVLGYDSADEISAADLIVSVAAWANLVQMFRAEPTSPVADMWHAICAASLRSSPLLSADARLEEAQRSADGAALGFLRRFPPRFEPVDRQALGDLVAMRAALDEQTEATERARELAAEWQSRYAQAVERAEKAEGHVSAAQTALVEIGRVAICPKPKPEQVEPGQRWAFVDDVAKVHGDTAKLLMGEDADSRWMIESKDWYYLGPAPTSEG